MDFNSILPNIVSSIVVIFLVWLINNSLRYFMKASMNEMLDEIRKKLEALSEIANENKANYLQMKTKIATISHDVYKLEKTTAMLSNRLSQVKCQYLKECDHENPN